MKIFFEYSKSSLVTKFTSKKEVTVWIVTFPKYSKPYLYFKDYNVIKCVFLENNMKHSFIDQISQKWFLQSGILIIAFLKCFMPFFIFVFSKIKKEIHYSCSRIIIVKLNHQINAAKILRRRHVLYFSINCVCGTTCIRHNINRRNKYIHNNKNQNAKTSSDENKNTM